MEVNRMSFYPNLSLSDAVDAMTDLSMALATDDYIMGEVNIDDGGYMDIDDEYVDTDDVSACDKCNFDCDDNCPELLALLGSM